jgi:hypothetical protein
LPAVGAVGGAGAAGDDDGYDDPLDVADADPAADRSPRRGMLVALVAVAVVVAAAIVVAFTGLPGSSDGAQSAKNSHRPGAVVGAPTPKVSHRATPSASASSRSSTSGQTSGSHGSAGSQSGSSGSSGSGSSRSGSTGSAVVPAGWQTYNSPEGWSVAHPPDWVVRTHTVRGQSVTDMVSSSGELLRVNITPTPFQQPIDDWRTFEPTFAKQVSDYRRIDLRALTVDGDPAADWEFTYSTGGALLHALDREIRSGDTVYAVLFQTHDDAWSGAAQDRQAVLASFRPGS